MFPKGTEWINNLVIARLIFGPKNLPKLGKSLGKTVKNIREGMSGDDAEDTSEETVVEAEDEDDEVAELEAKLAEAKAKKAASSEEK